MRLLLLFLVLSSLSSYAQTIPAHRTVDWTLAGLSDTSLQGFEEVDMEMLGAKGDGIFPNDSIVEYVLSNFSAPGIILKFPAGRFFFQRTIDLPSNAIIRGEGSENTELLFDLEGRGNAIQIAGSGVKSDTTSIIAQSSKDSQNVKVLNSELFSPGDWIQIIQNDTDLVTSSWAKQTVGQIVQIRYIDDSLLTLRSPLRIDLDTLRSPYIMRITPTKNVGIECLKIHRLDNTAPQQSSNIYFTYTVNSWVSGVESENCTFSHVDVRNSSNLKISKSYFHHAFDYGGGGRAYGVMLQSMTNECLVEDNIFEHLRHSMILQSGANGNVFAYNYSFDPYWDAFPSNAAGDIVLHGNYPFANLFEQNICQNIVIDNSHGPNGPFNTIFRNRAESYGIFFSALNSPKQNIVGNEIPNEEFPYSLVNYNILGEGHFIFGNNNKGEIHPASTDSLSDQTYVYINKPQFVPLSQWAGIGIPHILEANSIPARDREKQDEIFGGVCGNFPVDVNEADAFSPAILVYPNPVNFEVNIESPIAIESLSVINTIGHVVLVKEKIGKSCTLNASKWNEGVYFLLLHFSGHRSSSQKILKGKGF